MDEAGIPHSDSLPEPHPPSPDADSPTAETNNTTSTPHARAGESWTEAEDDLLIEQVKAGANLNDIAQKHGRSRRSNPRSPSRSSISSTTTPKSCTSSTRAGRSTNSPGPSETTRPHAANDLSAAESLPRISQTQMLQQPDDAIDRKQSEPPEQPSTNPPQADVPTLNDEPCRHDIHKRSAASANTTANPTFTSATAEAAFHSRGLPGSRERTARR